MSFLFAMMGCAADPPRLEAGVYRDGPLAFRIGDVPSTWRPVRVEGATLAFRDDPHLASILLDGRCNRKDDDVPLVALTDHLVMGTTGREILSQETMDYDIFVLKKDGCVYDFVYVDPAGDKNDERESGKAAFERFSATFHTLAGGREATRVTAPALRSARAAEGTLT